MFTRSIGVHIYGSKKAMPLPNCICNSDDITVMFISRYIFDIDRMKPGHPRIQSSHSVSHTFVTSFFYNSLDTWLRDDIIQWY